MSPRTNSTVLHTRDAIAALLNNTHHTQDTQDTLTWPVRLALSSAFNHLDDALPNLPALTPPPPIPPAVPPDEPHHEPSGCAGVAARVEALRADLLRLLEDPPEANADDVDPYAVGHAAGELGVALRELSTVRPA